MFCSREGRASAVGFVTWEGRAPARPGPAPSPGKQELAPPVRPGPAPVGGFEPREGRAPVRPGPASSPGKRELAPPVRSGSAPVGGFESREGRAPARPGPAPSPGKRELAPPVRSNIQPGVVDEPAGTIQSRHSPSRNSVLLRGFRTTVLFVTVCTKNREPVFDDSQMVSRLLTVWRNARAWHVGEYVIMPDHVHFMCAPGEGDVEFHRWITYWKSMFSRGLSCGIWQRVCWDTQIRNGADYAEKVEYMRMNPVRKGLVATPEDWPNRGSLFEIVWHDA